MLQTVFAPTPTMNEKNGNGKYKPLRRRKRNAKSENAQDFSYLASSDPRMRFNNAQDPIYFAFEYLEKRSVTQLMGDFVKDSFFEITNFVSKVVK